MKDLMDTLQKKAKDVNKIIAYSSDKLYRKRTLKKVQLLNQQFNSLVVETSDEAFQIYPKEFLEGFLTVATSAFDTNFNNLVKNLQNANQQLEKVAKDALNNTNDPKLVMVRKEQVNIFKNNVSVFNKCVAKLTLYHNVYILNTYKVISVVRSLK